MNQIIIAMDNDIPEGIRLISKTRESKEVYGYKIGSLWILDRGIDVLKTVSQILGRVDSDQKIILDMQKWGTDIPEIVTKQVVKVAPYVDELIVCPMGGGSESLKAFASTCIEHDINPICVLEMTHTQSGKYLVNESYIPILHDAVDYGILDFVIPATKEPKSIIHAILLSKYYPNGFKGEINFYVTGFKVQGGQTKPMVDFGVTKFILGRAIYESSNPIKAIHDIYKEINGDTSC